LAGPFSVSTNLVSELAHCPDAATMERTVFRHS